MQIMKTKQQTILLTLSICVFALLCLFVYRLIPVRNDQLERHQAKTTAEILIGKWKLVRFESGLPKGLQTTISYTKDGKVEIVSKNPFNMMDEVQYGRYAINDNTIAMTMDIEPHDRSLVIDTITSERLVLSGYAGTRREIHEFEKERGE